MRRLAIGASTLVAALLLAAPAHAQFFVSGSATVPTGDFKDFGDGTGAKTGWMAEAGYRIYQGTDGKLGLWLVGGYGSNKHDDNSGDKTNLMSGGAWLSYALGSNPDASVSPFVVAGGGYLNHQYKPATGSSENGGQAFAGGGVGLSFGKAGKGPWLLATYHQGFDHTTFFQFGAGWTF
jgi:hypothetical protein